MFLAQGRVREVAVVYVSRFIDDDAHFEEVPGCPLRHARSGGATRQLDETACARCRYNVAFPHEATIGCVVRTPASVVAAARERALQPLARELEVLRAAGPAKDAQARRQWKQLGERWLAAAAPDDANGRELAAVMLRFAAAPDDAAVEILR